MVLCSILYYRKLSTSSENDYGYALYKNKNMLIDPEFYDTTKKSKSKSEKKIDLIPFIILLTLEMIFLFFSVNMAVKVSKNSLELLIQLMIAILFPIPYVFISATFNTNAYRAYIQR